MMYARAFAVCFAIVITRQGCNLSGYHQARWLLRGRRAVSFGTSSSFIPAWVRSGMGASIEEACAIGYTPPSHVWSTIVPVDSPPVTDLRASP